MFRSANLVLLLALIASSCRAGDPRTSAAVPTGGDSIPAARPAATSSSYAAPARDSASRRRAPNELGRVLVLEYHLIGEKDARWERHRDSFRRDLEMLYDRGYRPVSVSELVDRQLDLPAGLSPVVFTFDDASPSHFRYVERPDGSLVIDSTSAAGIWLDFAKKRPDWRNRAVFCLLSNAEAGRAFFGNKDIEGQKTEWRFPKLRFLAEQGFELCAHTLWHARLDKYADSLVQEQIARNVMAIDSAVPGYRVRTFALPLGIWPKNRALAVSGSWTDPRTKRVARYEFDAVLEVAGGPTVSPHDPAFDPHSIERTQVFGAELARILDQMDRNGQRYVSDGDPATVARPAAPVAMRR
jgi:hypothetical protein